jgi:hypothetical protein
VDYQALFQRILQSVDNQAYLTPTDHVDPKQRAAIEIVKREIQSPEFNVLEARRLARALHAQGHLDRVMYLSALHVIAASPKVKDWEEAARLVGEQEFAALELGGPNLQANLASVDRHRGVLAFMRNHYGVALDYFTRTLERQRTAENLGNVLCCLLALGDEDEARELVDHIRQSLPDMVPEINQIIDQDPDLALLRSPEAS